MSDTVRYRAQVGRCNEKAIRYTLRYGHGHLFYTGLSMQKEAIRGKKN